MSRNSSGTYAQPSGTTAISGATIDPTAFNTLITDLGTELTNSLDRGGRGAMTAALNAGGFKITNAADPSVSTDLATKNYVDSLSGLTGNAKTANNLSDLASASTARTNLGLGTAAVVNTGTSAGNAVILDGSARLPAVNASLLTNIAGANLVRTVVSEYATMTTISATIPFDDTIPQIGEGTEVLTVSVPVDNGTQTVRLRYSGPIGSSGAAVIATALFVGSTANALDSNFTFVNSSGVAVLDLDKVVTPGAAGTYVYRIRVGGTGATTLTLNGSGGLRYFGGSMSHKIIAEVWSA